MTVRGFYYRSGGQRFCHVCQEVGGAHSELCPILAIDAQLRELAAGLGLYVSTMRETIDLIHDLLADRDDH